MTNNFQDLLHDKIIHGLDASALAAIERARKTGTRLVVWRGGKIVEISPDEIELEISVIEPKAE